VAPNYIFSAFQVTIRGPASECRRYASQIYASTLCMAVAHKGQPIRAYAEADAERLAELLPTLAERHAVLVVDTAGFGNQAAAVAIAGAVLVPVTPGEADLVEAQRTVAYVHGLSRSTRRPIEVRVVANRIRRGTMLSGHVLTELDTLKLPRLQIIIGEAVAFGEIGFSGAIPKEGVATEEITALLAELRAAGGLPKLSIRQGIKA
jgi:chromosome partitioning protein